MPELSRRGSGASPSEIEEAYRLVRANLLITIADLRNPAVLVTSAHSGEGKTEVCARMGTALAAAGRRVVLVDLDIRHPDLHRRLATHGDDGAVDVLTGRRKLDDCVQFIDAPTPTDPNGGFYLLPAGSGDVDVTELLGSARSRVLLDRLAAQADIVLIDTPPVLAVADTLVIGRMAAGAIIVVEAEQTPATDVIQVRDALTRAQTRVLGVVLNKTIGRPGGYRYGYGYNPSSTRADST